MKRIQIINGPNLNMLGKRQPEIYGSRSFEDFLNELRTDFPQLQLSYFQSNHEGAIIDKIQELMQDCDGLIINPAAYGHTSIAIADALAMLAIPIIEVHISDIYEREPFRHHTFTAAYARKQFVGHGLGGYRLAVEALLAL
ncbi:MAG TPA: type II 3-dehydroquinate dehydratase [Edaphocola sp.]|nr:type II 3-dehydroquinate dehydratase [Edaphocola sp.]